MNNKTASMSQTVHINISSAGQSHVLILLTCGGNNNKEDAVLGLRFQRNTEKEQNRDEL